MKHEMFWKEMLKKSQEKQIEAVIVDGSHIPTLFVLCRQDFS